MTETDIALLLVEDAEFCPLCLSPLRETSHAAGCHIDLALAERGFCTAADRDAARERLRAAVSETEPAPAEGT